MNKLFNLNTNIDNIDHFEVYSKNTSNYKINFIYNTFSLNQNFTNNVLKIIDELNNLFNKTPVYSGITNNNDISLYYSFTK